MKDDNYIPSGNLQGDTKAMPDAGNTTGMNGDSYGCDLSTDATNSMGGMGGSTKSDPMMENCNCKPTKI